MKECEHIYGLDDDKDTGLIRVYKNEKWLLKYETCDKFNYCPRCRKDLRDIDKKEGDK